LEKPGSRIFSNNCAYPGTNRFTYNDSWNSGCRFGTFDIYPLCLIGKNSCRFGIRRLDHRKVYMESFSLLDLCPGTFGNRYCQAYSGCRGNRRIYRLLGRIGRPYASDVLQIRIDPSRDDIIGMSSTDFAGSSNGRTRPSGGWYRGSNPCPAAIRLISFAHGRRPRILIMKENPSVSENHSGTLEITRKDRGRSFRISVGDRVEILLPERHINDYRWVTVILDEKILKNLLEEYTEPSLGKRKDAYGQKLMVLEAVGSGQTKVVLYYKRPGELGGELSEIFRIGMDVSPGNSNGSRP
jgi:predicted secreted protein